MKIIVTLGQLALLCFGASHLAEWRTIPQHTELAVYSLIIIIPSLLTLYYVHFWSASDIQKLTHERRRLEEQAKIDKLKSEAK